MPALDSITNNLSEDAKRAMFNAVRAVVAEQGTSGAAQYNNGISIGSSGNTLNQVLMSAITLAPASISTATIVEQTFAIAMPLATTDTVFVSRKTSQAEPGIVGVRVSAPSTLAIAYINTSGQTQTPSTQVYNIVAVH